MDISILRRAWPQPCSRRAIRSLPPIYSRNLDSVQLCVLSSCESGSSAENTGDEFVGSLRALFVARVQGVVCSTWPVDDAATGRLFGSAYRRWLAGTPIDRALNAAAREIRDVDGPNGPWRDPFYWAGFRFFGRC
jgi:CHAT domain-containing protein